MPKISRCDRCKADGSYSSPGDSGDDEGYHYVICSAHCGRDSAWAKTKRGAIEEWNRWNSAGRKHATSSGRSAN